MWSAFTVLCNRRYYEKETFFSADRGLDPERASNGESSIRSNQTGAPVVDPKANSLKTVKSVAFNVRRDVTSAARYVAASNVFVRRLLR